jgi:general stress protein YciG
MPNRNTASRAQMSASSGGSGRSRRGFAGMDSDKQREIASKGGKAAHQSGNAHKWTSDEAREAGRKGGQASGGSRGRR